MEIVNLLDGDLPLSNDRPGFSWRRARVAGEQLAASVYELLPGEKTWPHHLHYGNEEWLVVLSGRATLRGADLEQELAPGSLAFFPAGPAGAHQLVNRCGQPARVVLLSTLNVPGSTRYPDSRKISVRTGADEALVFREDDEADYWEGES